MKRLVGSALLLALLMGCTGGTKEAADDGVYKLGIILDSTGLGDKNFNDMTYAGATRAKEDLGIEFDYVTPSGPSDYESLMRSFSEGEDYDLILAIGTDMLEPLELLAEEYPEQKYTIIDIASEKRENIRGIATKQNEQTFLSGVLAGLVTQSEEMPFANTDSSALGVVMGVEYPNIIGARNGFEAGARYVNPEARVYTKTANTWSDPVLGKTYADELATTNGADVVLHIAGLTGVGVFEGATENNYYAVGMGANQNTIQPDNILVTATRDVGALVYNEMKEIIDGTWVGGPLRTGLADGAVGYTLEGSNIQIPAEYIEIMEAVRQEVINGEITVPDDSADIDQWAAENQFQR